MKNFFILFFILMFFIACDDVSTSRLAGKWQLKTVEKAGIETVVDTVWYNFQSESVFQYQYYVSQQDTFMLLLGLRSQQDNILYMELISEAYLDQTDWTGVNRSFTIEKLDKKNLILVSEEGYNYSFIRF